MVEVTNRFQCCCSVVMKYLTLCDPMDCSMPGPSVPLSPDVCSDSCPLSWWCYLTISSSPALCLQSSPASGSFPIHSSLKSWLYVCLPLQTELLEGRRWDLLSFESPALGPWRLCNKCLITNGSSNKSITAGPLQTSSVECLVVSSLEQVD